MRNKIIRKLIDVRDGELPETEEIGNIRAKNPIIKELKHAIDQLGVNEEDRILNEQGDKGVPKIKLKLWEHFKNVFGLTCQGKIGVCKKERFKNTCGNDQLWESKGDKREYNTDFIGMLRVGVGEIEEPVVPAAPVALNYELEEIRHNNDILHPYVFLDDNKINIENSWLSDHALVYARIPIHNPQGIAGGGKSYANFKNGFVKLIGGSKSKNSKGSKKIRNKKKLFSKKQNTKKKNR